jgi:hypothetical protein
MQELDAKQIVNIYEVAHVFATLMHLAKNSLLNHKTSADILSDAKAYVVQLGKL